MLPDPHPKTPLHDHVQSEDVQICGVVASLAKSHRVGQRILDQGQDGIVEEYVL
jgi:predicted amino acid racemase